jgi:hypothetical protein
MAGHWIREETDYSPDDIPGPERTFGGAVEMTVRAMSVVPDRSTTTLPTPDSRAFSDYNGRDARGSMQGSGFGDNAQWESYGRRTRNAVTGSRRSSNGHRFKMVEHKVLEDNSERTISIWREEVARSSDGSSTLNGGDTVSEFGQMSEADSHWNRRWSMKDMANSKSSKPKYGKNGAPFVPATAQSMLGLSGVRPFLLVVVSGADCIVGISARSTQRIRCIP